MIYSVVFMFAWLLVGLHATNVVVTVFNLNNPKNDGVIEWTNVFASLVTVIVLVWLMIQ